MNQKTFTLTAGVVFALVAGMHALRLLLGWEAIIGGWQVPRWVSWPALALAGFLSYTAFTLTKRPG
ncbi:MAG: hypothetical protein HY597_06145 [Candidatus Omnitrophica bacterium]|nr:hypothetical protein [Candidatus Omnitrophota bacterium]